MQRYGRCSARISGSFLFLFSSLLIRISSGGVMVVGAAAMLAIAALVLFLFGLGVMVVVAALVHGLG